MIPRYTVALRIVPALLSSVIVCGLLAMRMATAADGPPAWAYTPNNPDYKPPVDDGKPVRVPDSTAGYTWSQLRDRFVAPVWHPIDHSALPDIVANGRKPGVFACGYCHRATGPGGPENADLAGLPKSYIIQQMADYKSGARGTTLPGRTPPKLMIELSKPITDAEIEAAAAYFSALRPRKRIKWSRATPRQRPMWRVCFGLRWKPASASRSERGSWRSPTICSASKAATLDRPSQRMYQSGASPKARR